MLTTVSRHLVFPMMDRRDPYRRLQVARDLEKAQWLDASTLRQRQVERLRDIVRYAARHCPFYRARFDAMSLDASALDLPASLATLPLLTKEEIRSGGDQLISDEFGVNDLVESRTGGSTGVALTIFADRRCQAIRNAAAMRSDGWAGWSPGTRVAALWGNPPVFKALRPWLRNALYDRLSFLDTMNMTPEAMTAFLKRCNWADRYVIYGHAHSIYLYADFLRTRGYAPKSPVGIVATSMMLLESDRKVIESVFQVKVSNRYGCEEVGLIASECECHDGLHVNIDHVFLEIVDDEGRQVPDGCEGQVVVTDLVNRGQPLIRYAVGDRAVASSRTCGCGRGLPLIERLTGRTADFLIRRDGSRVAGISMIERTLTLVRGIRQMQIVQNAIDDFTLNVSPDAAYSEESSAQLRAEFAETFGANAAVTITMVDSIDRLPSGKYRFSICRVQPGAPPVQGADRRHVGVSATESAASE